MSRNAPTALWIIPFFNILFDHVEDAADKAEYSECIRDTAVQKRCKLHEYYSKTNTTTMLCTLLDPRRRLMYFRKRKFPKEETDRLRATWVRISPYLLFNIEMLMIHHQQGTWYLQKEIHINQIKRAIGSIPHHTGCKVCIGCRFRLSRIHGWDGWAVHISGRKTRTQRCGCSQLVEGISSCDTINMESRYNC